MTLDKNALEVAITAIIMSNEDGKPYDAQASDTITAYLSALPGENKELITRLREYTAFRYAGNCKCGNCQLVPRPDLEATIAALEAADARVAGISGPCRIDGCKQPSMKRLAQLADAAESRASTLAAEVERMRAVAREAHRFGFWSLCGPINDVEVEECELREEKTWAEFSAALTAPAPGRETTELPDDLRAPLHSLRADVDYLVARIRTADDEEASLLKESIQNRLSQIEEAAYRLNGRAIFTDPAPGGERNVSEDGCGAARQERERIVAALREEARSTPCAEDAKIVEDCANLVEADFSYEEAEKIAIARDAVPASPRNGGE